MVLLLRSYNAGYREEVLIEEREVMYARARYGEASTNFLIRCELLPSRDLHKETAKPGGEYLEGNIVDENLLVYIKWV